MDKQKFNAYRIIISKEKWVCLDKDENETIVNRHDFSIKIQNRILTFDCVFNAIHGSPGEDGLMQAYFALLEIPHTSCGHYQAAITFNKRDLLSTLKPYGIKAANSYYLNLGDKIDHPAIVEKVGLPCFVKANKAGSSFGISKVYEKNDLQAAIDKAFIEDDEIIIESFLHGTEVSVGVIKLKAKLWYCL